MRVPLGNKRQTSVVSTGPTLVTGGKQVAGVGWSRKPIAWPGLTGRATKPRRASLANSQGIRELVSKLLANALSEIAICLIRLNDLMRVTGYLDRIDSSSDQIIGPPGAPAIVCSSSPNRSAVAGRRTLRQ